MNADSLTPAAPGDVRLRGRAGAAADACLLARADSDWARGPMYDECVNSFRTHWDDTNPDGPGWQNEYWGKTMLCFAGAVAYTRDPELRSWVLARAHEFIAEFQKPNGYLSTYSREDFLRNHPENPDARTHWCFNVWGRKYTLWIQRGQTSRDPNEKSTDFADLHGNPSSRGGRGLPATRR